MQQLPNYPAGNNPVNSQPKNQQARGNVAAVEPYNHVPHAQSIHNNNFQVSFNEVKLHLKKPIVYIKYIQKFKLLYVNINKIHLYVFFRL